MRVSRNLTLVGPWRRLASHHLHRSVRCASQLTVFPRAQFRRKTPLAEGEGPIDLKVALSSSSSSSGKVPPASADGGSQVEFETYWAANKWPQRWGDWIERRAHPQLSIEAYWYNCATGHVTFERPVECAGEPEKVQNAEGQADPETRVFPSYYSFSTVSPSDSSPSSSSASSSSSSAAAAPDEDKSTENRQFARAEPTISGTSEGSDRSSGAVWTKGVQELKEDLALERSTFKELPPRELARRAVQIYEDFDPRVLSWHDYQHLTFWFFGGIDRPGKSAGTASPGPDLFVGQEFFEEVADILVNNGGRPTHMHPISLTYMLWTFVRAGVHAPQLFEAVGDYCLQGVIPMMDRCALGTMVWNFSKGRYTHHAFFDAAASELARPNRVRSLAPRNFQNVFLAYGWSRHFDEKMYLSLMQGMARNLDGHRPVGPKCARDHLFSYTCKDGFEVLADSFRISSLEVILRALHRMNLIGDDFEDLVTSMADYVKRSLAESPKMMRDRGDAAKFATEVAITAIRRHKRRKFYENILTKTLPLSEVYKDCPAQVASTLKKALTDASLDHLPGSGVQKRRG